MGTTRRPQKRMARRDCSRTATAAWAAVSGGDSPPSHAPSVPAGSGLPPSGTTRVATGASQNTPGFLERNAVGWLEGRPEKGQEEHWDRGVRGHPPHPNASGTCDTPCQKAHIPGPGATSVSPAFTGPRLTAERPKERPMGRPQWGVLCIGIKQAGTWQEDRAGVAWLGRGQRYLAELRFELKVDVGLQNRRVRPEKARLRGLMISKGVQSHGNFGSRQVI